MARKKTSWDWKNWWRFENNEHYLVVGPFVRRKVK